MLARLKREDHDGTLWRLCPAVAEECKFKLTLADILERLPNGPASAEAAWVQAVSARVWDETAHPSGLAQGDPGRIPLRALAR